MQKIHVPVHDAYDVLVERGILPKCGEIIKEIISAETCVIITDDNVDKFYSDTVEQSLQHAGFRTAKFVFPHGETSKSAETLLKIYTFLCLPYFSFFYFLIKSPGSHFNTLASFTRYSPRALLISFCCCSYC